MLYINDQVAPNTEVKITRQDNKIVPVNYDGQFKVKGPQTAVGYWNDTGIVSTEVEAGGWFNASRSAMMDSNGKITFGDKQKTEVL